jgi:hypothetical protein
MHAAISDIVVILGLMVFWICLFLIYYRLKLCRLGNSNCNSNSDSNSNSNSNIRVDFISMSVDVGKTNLPSYEEASGLPNYEEACEASYPYVV